jgi:hypothetical protein
MLGHGDVWKVCYVRCSLTQRGTPSIPKYVGFSFRVINLTRFIKC